MLCIIDTLLCITTLIFALQDKSQHSMYQNMMTATGGMLSQLCQRQLAYATNVRKLLAEQREQITTFSSRHRSLGAVPEEVFGFEKLTELDLGDNALTSLPHQLVSLVKLKK